MGLWFSHGSGIDAHKESEECRKRAVMPWSHLITRLIDAFRDPLSTIEDDGMVGVPSLGFYRWENEAMVYRMVGNPPKPQVLIMQQVISLFDEGKVKAEAQRRNELR